MTDAFTNPNKASPYHKYILFLKDAGGNEKYQIWYYHLETGKPASCACLTPPHYHHHTTNPPEPAA